MVEVVQATRARIDLLLGLLLSRWREVPRVAAEIDGWDLLDQLRYTESWPNEDERLRTLDAYAAGATLTPEQHERYLELKELVARNEAILRRVLDT
jgi:hypothetical protein